MRAKNYLLTALILIAALAILGMQMEISKLQAEVGNQGVELARLNDQMSQIKAISNFDLQEKCDRQAERVANSYTRGDVQLEYFVSHYNSKLKKCFTIVSTLYHAGSQIFHRTRTLVDAMERTAYGSYYVMINNQSWDDPAALRSCKVGGKFDQIECKSQDEWENLTYRFLSE